MTIKYIPTTKEIDTTKETEIILTDSEFMFYSMIRELIEEMQRARTAK